MDRAEAIKFAEYAQIMAMDKPEVQEFYKLAEAALREQERKSPCSLCGYGGKHLDAPPCTKCPAHPKEQEQSQWVSVKERLPEVEKRVLVCVARHSQYTNKDYTLVTCAIYEDGKVDVEDSCWMCEWGDYDEEADVIHVPEGWYEYHEYGNTEEDGIAFIGDSGYLAEKVTHWMPLPMPPKEEEK